MNCQKVESFKLNYQEHMGLECKTPCSLYSVLIEKQIIDNPNWGENEKKYIDIAKHDCEFVAEFDIGDDILKEARQELVFKGIDTIAEIYLNGVLLGTTNNMHRTWSFNIKGICRAKSNCLAIKFVSPINYVNELNNKHPICSPDCALPAFGHIRKMYCSFGWDWGPVVCDSGIYREVLIIGSSSAELSNVYVQQFHKDDKVMLRIKPEIRHYSENTQIEVAITTPNGKVLNANGVGTQFEIEINDPQLWWPKGYGEQALYSVAVSLREGSEVIDSITQKIGLRTITISQDADEWGNEFCFKVNGLKIFSKGANYIPMDTLLCNITYDKTKKLLEDCVFANFNTIRVWGGGYYPDDYFYDICDELGLIVWQDFMFACSETILFSEFEDTVKKEVEEFLKRVRNHACLGLLCGNNEVETAWVHWNWSDNLRKKTDYIQLFERIIPAITKALSPDVFYWPSSPSSEGSFCNPNSESRGDTHCWEIWHGNEPFDNYRKKFSRFCSEYGYEAFPSIKTLRQIGTEKDMNPFSPVMDAHQKCKKGNVKIVSTAADYFRYCYSFENFIFISQVLQAEAIRTGAEHFRRNRGRCMGSIYWQLNDNWQTASWSSIDYCGRYKALHYFARRFYAPILLSMTESNKKVFFFVSNESAASFAGQVRWKLCDSSFKEINAGSFSIDTDRFSSMESPLIDFTNEILNHEDEYFLLYQLLRDDEVVSEGTHIFVKPKYFNFVNPNISFSFDKKGDSVLLHIKSDAFVKYLEIDFKNIDVDLSDNFFDIGCAEAKTILITNCPYNIEQLEEQLIWRCANTL